MLQKASLLFFLCLGAVSSYTQRIKKADKGIIKNLESHVSFLASDRLEGRRAGTRGEKFAMEYIAAQFRQAGLEAYGDKKDWYQAFDIYEGKEIAKSSYLFVNGEEIKAGNYFPFISFAGQLVEGAPAIALRESGSPWFLNIKEVLDENKNNPHFDLKAFILQQATDAAAKGATAFLVYNTGDINDGLQFDSKEKAGSLKIPVLYILKKAAIKYFTDESATLDIKLKIKLDDKKRIGHNVVGYINNGAPNTIIVGAHFDHLGFGEDSNSLYRGTEKMIHNGADDNASGTAALIELSKLLKHSKLKSNNYLCIAFSGEELGLYGSKYYTEHPSIDLSKANYMINMDMVGRLNDSSKTITIGGYGTSPWWGQLFNLLKSESYFVTKFDSSGSGPSDHTSFYRKDIPVLFFFTGLHTDYHKPSDDFDKINYPGTYRIIKYIQRIVEATDSKTKLAFAKTRETATTTSARFSVTMGIMPDYTYGGTGVRVDGVSENRPAQQAGIKTGDVIVQLGTYPISSVETYMQTLSKFKKGDKTNVTYKRGSETLQAPVQF
jgi:aminopeptidase YwaD